MVCVFFFLKEKLPCPKYKPRSTRMGRPGQSRSRLLDTAFFKWFSYLYYKSILKGCLIYIMHFKHGSSLPLPSVPTSHDPLKVAECWSNIPTVFVAKQLVGFQWQDSLLSVTEINMIPSSRTTVSRTFRASVDVGRKESSIWVGQANICIQNFHSIHRPRLQIYSILKPDLASAFQVVVIVTLKKNVEGTGEKYWISN